MVSFAVAIIAGTILLLLPLSTKSGQISYVDALFTATSGVCVTGLTVQDTATYFTPFGQTVILILFQLGGLGIMTFSTLVLLVAGKKISIQDKVIIQEGYYHTALKDVKSLIKNIFLYALSLELLGTIALFFCWQGELSWGKRLFPAVFHSISAFCNAGFSLFSDSFMSYRSNIGVNIVLIMLIILGGLGFLVILEIREVFSRVLKRKRIQISLHAKLVLFMTAFLIVFSFAVFLAVEWDYSLQGFTVQDKIFSSLFQVITPRTAGFNTLEMNSLSLTAVFLLISLMVVGASPGSTGGGVKTSTVGVIFAFLRSKIKARDSVHLFFKTLPLELIIKAFTLITLSFCLIFLSSFILFLTQSGLGMKEVFFEVFSAFGTVGLSMGITPKLSAAGKIVIILTMFIGRIGPLTLLYAFSRQKAYGRFEYVEENVMIG